MVKRNGLAKAREQHTLRCGLIRESSFALFGKNPPRLWLAAVCEMDQRKKNIDHAWIVLDFGQFAEPRVHCERILADELFGFGDSEHFEIAGCGGTDIG